jgi:hypothetical protein
MTLLAVSKHRLTMGPDIRHSREMTLDPEAGADPSESPRVQATPFARPVRHGTDKSAHEQDTVEQTPNVGVTRLMRVDLDLERVIGFERPAVRLLTLLPLPIKQA